MARCRVTYREVADERPAGTSATVLDLVDDTPPSPPVRRDRRRRPRWPAAVAVLVVAAAAVGLLRPADAGSEASPPPATHQVRSKPGPVVVATSSVVPEPWSGVFEHHPEARPPDSVPRVHLVALRGVPARALLVVDATKRVFGGAGQRAADGSVRVLGPERGAGVRSLQWDAGGYGVSLTAVGLTIEEQRHLADAVRLPEGPSLTHGRPPDVDAGALAELGLSIAERRSGAATPFGSPLIGQSGGASIEGQLHQLGAHRLLVSVVEDQLVSASALRSALGEVVELDDHRIDGVELAAVVDHGRAPTSERRIHGRTRLVLDHVGGVTIELSSDVLGPGELVEAGHTIDLDRLVRTTAPLGAGEG